MAHGPRLSRGAQQALAGAITNPGRGPLGRERSFWSVNNRLPDYQCFLVCSRPGNPRIFFFEFHLASPIEGKAEGEGRSRPGSQEAWVLPSPTV